jgi:di-N-acetylchitobiase
VAEKVDQVKSDKLDGVFFDFEGQINDDQKKAYTELAQETTAALKPLNASVFVCVGARPSYEFRSYDYSGLADAVDFLFIMGYDAHFWDDYTCVLKGTCSPAEASIKDLKAGVDEYSDKVKGEKLVLGLPWYGQRYTRVVLPINEGQIDYADVVAVMDKKGRVKSKTLDKDSQTWKIVCNGACVDGKKGGEIWIDDATTLAPKYALAKQNKLRGVGVWEADKLPTDDKHDKERKAMWAALAAWDGEVAAAGTNATATAAVTATDPACCFCANGGDGSGACFEVSKCNEKQSYSCHGQQGCQWVPQKSTCV